jgi:hypothetical protein
MKMSGCFQPLEITSICADSNPERSATDLRCFTRATGRPGVAPIRTAILIQPISKPGIPHEDDTADGRNAQIVVRLGSVFCCASTRRCEHCRWRSRIDCREIFRALGDPDEIGRRERYSLYRLDTLLPEAVQSRILGSSPNLVGRMSE